MKNFAKVTIYNKHLYVTRKEEVEAYTLDQLFSDMGKQICSAIVVSKSGSKSQYR